MDRFNIIKYLCFSVHTESTLVVITKKPQELATRAIEQTSPHDIKTYPSPLYFLTA